MRVFGIVLIVTGILMMVFNGFNFTTEKEIADLGPIEINKKESKTVVWPTYAGIAVLVAGIAAIAIGGKKS
jgi:hypothetical protein